MDVVVVNEGWDDENGRINCCETYIIDMTMMTPPSFLILIHFWGGAFQARVVLVAWFCASTKWMVENTRSKKFRSRERRRTSTPNYSGDVRSLASDANLWCNLLTQASDTKLWHKFLMLSLDTRLSCSLHRTQLSPAIFERDFLMQSSDISFWRKSIDTIFWQKTLTQYSDASFWRTLLIYPPLSEKLRPSPVCSTKILCDTTRWDTAKTSNFHPHFRIFI